MPAAKNPDVDCSCENAAVVAKHAPKKSDVMKVGFVSCFMINRC